LPDLKRYPSFRKIRSAKNFARRALTFLPHSLGCFFFTRSARRHRHAFHAAVWRELIKSQQLFVVRAVGPDCSAFRSPRGFVTLRMKRESQFNPGDG
jgi:hypothetical protein